MKSTAALRRAILSRRAAVAVVGQGYVGVTLASVAASAGFRVSGIDVDEARISDLNEGKLTVPGVIDQTFRSGIESGNMTFWTSYDAVERSDVVLVCVPTPVRDNTPDLSHVERACKEVGRYLRAGSVVVLESTTYPGTTDEIVRPALENSGLLASRDFLLAYSPERIDPGNQTFLLQNTPKVVGALTQEGAGVAALFYGQLVEKVVVVSSCRAAELVKLLENTYRHVNIALVNEMAMLCNDMGIDVWEVLEAAATKPFGFMPFVPGPGVGGHCIPVDPTYLAWQVRRDAGRQFRILEEAEDVNAQMPAYVCSRIADVLNDAGKAMKGATILVLGVGYKPNVGDIRESPSLRVIQTLERRRATVQYHDPFVPSLSFNGTTLARTELNARSLARADCVALLTPHDAYDLAWIAEHAALVFDARNAYGARRPSNVVRL